MPEELGDGRKHKGCYYVELNEKYAHLAAAAALDAQHIAPSSFNARGGKRPTIHTLCHASRKSARVQPDSVQEQTGA